tara:strand:+ start:344 stop:1078 length:735 start_codon:yes stop_codon:yes gene_type:complete
MDYVSVDFIIILGVIIFFTLIQSIFGVGLLVFGTPTLLLIGYSFYDTLSYLLPCSVVVSVLQLKSGWFLIRIYKSAVPQYMLPGVVFGLVIVIYYLSINLNLIIGLALLLTFLIRFIDKINMKLENFIGNYFRLGFFFTGFVHGLTNLGGALLVVITNFLYEDKKEIQANIAYAYLFMALSQLLILLISSSFLFSIEVLVLPLISGSIYIYFGRYIFKLSSDIFYHNLMSFLILVYGFLLLLNN